MMRELINFWVLQEQLTRKHWYILSHQDCILLMSTMSQVCSLPKFILYILGGVWFKHKNGNGNGNESGGE